MKPMGKLLAVALVALITGCNYGAASFHCERDDQCGAGGRCEVGAGGLCSFPASDCPSGYRFGDLAGPQSNQCVGAQPVDAALPIDAAIDGPPPDAAIDAPVDAPIDAAQLCFGTFTNICLQSLPSAEFRVDAPTTIDTGTSPSCAQVTTGGDICVISATTITINAALRATGTRPLVLLARDSLVINASGSIDVGSHRGATPETGANSDPATGCAAGTAPGVRAGGAGGSFAGAGGNGGDGGNGGNGGQRGNPTGAVAVMRGGCAGQDGDGGNRGVRGHGGGAVLLIAPTIDHSGPINAAGEGGSAGTDNSSGGGGGGAGGMIVLDATTITGTALLLANGGGGGEGSGTDTAGENGGDPIGTGAALGGNDGSNNGGNGGNGSAGAAAGGGGSGANGANGGTPGGGGAGGGGAGLIRARTAQNLGPNVSPTVTPF
jgi:hypothetical protein